jgi:hypothetical protein
MRGRSSYFDKLSMRRRAIRSELISHPHAELVEGVRVAP